MAEVRKAREESFSAVVFRRHLVVCLTAFCPDQTVVLETCRDLMIGIDADSQVPVQEALHLIIGAKVAALEKLRARRGKKLRLDTLFQNHILPLLDVSEQENGWKLFCLTLHLLEPPCESLLVDYYIRERDEALVPNHWNVRAGCVRTLRAAIAKRLGA